MDSLSEVNLAIWNALGTTDPKFTKEVSFGRKFTAINSQYQVREVTRYFGPVGKAWGCEYTREILEGMDEIPVVVTCHLWYVPPGAQERVNVPPRSACVPLYPKNKLDRDAFKKAETEAMSKSFSMIGVSADVFLGMYDDNAYVAEQRRAEAAKEQAARKQAPADAKPLPAPDVPAHYPAGMDPGAAMEQLRKAFDAEGNPTDVLKKLTDVQWTNKMNQYGVYFFGEPNWLFKYLAEKHPEYLDDKGKILYAELPPPYKTRLFTKFYRAALGWRKVYGNWRDDYPKIVEAVGLKHWLDIEPEAMEEIVGNGLRVVSAQEAAV